MEKLVDQCLRLQWRDLIQDLACDVSPLQICLQNILSGDKLFQSRYANMGRDLLIRDALKQPLFFLQNKGLFQIIWHVLIVQDGTILIHRHSIDFLQSRQDLQWIVCHVIENDIAF